MIQRMVLFGASGDLTSRLLLPAVSQLAERDSLPPGLTIVGAANTDWSTQDFREHIAARLREHSRASAAAQARVVDMLAFEPADVTDPADVRRVIGKDGPSTLVYLALPPVLLPAVLAALASADLRADDAVAIEKPFGTDLASAQQLNETLRIQLPAPTIFRVDHFLSNELVRRVVSLRFLNRVFAPAWNAENIERVDISWLEDLTLEGRASYYDGAGRDEGHAPEPPHGGHGARRRWSSRLAWMPTRSGRCGWRRCGPWPPLLRSGCAATTVRARYTAGTIGARAVPSYVDEPGVDPARNTETYAALTLDLNTPRWSGVPFTIRSGKALERPSAEIAVHFRALPTYLTDQWPGVEPNILRIGLTEPYVRLSTTLNGPERTAEQRQLETTSAAPPLTAYAHLIEHMLHNDPMLFIRGDEAEESWRIVDPVMQAWSSGAVELQEYPAGGAAPDPLG